MTESELAEVERLVNQQILANTEVITDVMDLDQALATGAMALFGEKYGESVRVVSDSRLQPGALRWNPCPSHRRYRPLQDCLRGQHFRRSPAHRSGHRRRRARALSIRQRPACASRPASHTSEAAVLEHMEKLLEQQKASERQLDALKTQAGAPADRKSGRAPNQRGDGHCRKVEGLDAKQLRTVADHSTQQVGKRRHRHRVR